jgi:uncharacterized membrane protein YhaH (DUF805 family)
MNYFLIVLQKYAQFTGRARRSEYWYFSLIAFVISFVLGFIDGILGFDNMGFGLLSGLFQLGILIPSIAVGVRRMHDVGKSGWFLLIPIYNLVLALTEGNKGENQYGADPKSPLDREDIKEGF